MTPVPAVAPRAAGFRARLLGAGILALAACYGGPTESPFTYFADRDGDGLSDSLEATLAAQYRPWWVFDAAEPVPPMSVTEFAGLRGANVAGGDTVAYDDLASFLAAVLLHPGGTLHLPPGPFGGNFGPPVYVEAVPFPRDLVIEGRADLVWLQYFLLFADDVKEYFPSASHRGDWEHVCVLVERAAAGDPARPPVMIHWHHHGSADIASQAEEWHADARGLFHPRAYVERGGHAMYRVRPPAPPPDPGPNPAADPLAAPLVFLQLHAGQPEEAALEARAVREFLGTWGQTPPTSLPIGVESSSPRGPLVFNGICDHDYTASPGAGAFALGGCEGP